MRAVARSSALLIACAAAVPAGAANFDYDASLGAGHSDNIRRTAANEEDENIVAAGLRFSLDQRTARLQADAVGDLAYAEYLDETYDSEVLGNFVGNARFAIVPERLEWTVSDNFGQVLSDPFAPATPDNRENINFFTTGPDATLKLGSQTRLRLGARYSMATYEDSKELESDAVSGEMGLVRLLSEASSVSLNLRQQQIEYQQSTLDADYDQSEAFLRYQVEGARTHLAVDVGYTEVERDAASQSDSGPLFRLDAERRVSPSTTATFTAGREFSNSGAAFAGAQGVGGSIGTGTAPGQQTAQPFTHSYATLGWNFARARSGFGLFANWSDQSYEGASQNDQELIFFGGQFRRALSANTSATLRAVSAIGKFAQQNADYNDLNGGLAFTWDVGRNVSIDLSYDYFERSSDLAVNDYRENRFWLTFSYGRGTPRTAPLRPEFAVDQRT